MDGSRCIGLNQAQVGEGFDGPSFCCVVFAQHGLERAVFSVTGQNRISFFLFKVFSFFFFWENKMISVMT
jgi:hypothetical protein